MIVAIGGRPVVEIEILGQKLERIQAADEHEPGQEFARRPTQRERRDAHVYAQLATPGTGLNPRHLKNRNEKDKPG